MADLSREVWLAYTTGTVVYGARKVIRLLKTGKERPKLVILAKNAPEEARLEIQHLCSVAGVPLLTHGGSLDLGRMLRKPFFVSVLAVMDPGESSILTSAGIEEE